MERKQHETCVRIENKSIQVPPNVIRVGHASRRRAGRYHSGGWYTVPPPTPSALLPFPLGQWCELSLSLCPVFGSEGGTASMDTLEQSESEGKVEALPFIALESLQDHF